MDTVQRLADPFKLKAFMLIIKDMGIQAFECFSSFALKTVILQHSRICMDSSDVSKCITESLEHIREKLFLTLNPAVYLFQAIDVTNVFDSRQRVIGQKINKDIVLTNCLKALDDVLELLYKGPYELHKLIPVNSGALLHYINSIDYSSETWLDRLRNLTAMKTKLFEILSLPQEVTAPTICQCVVCRTKAQDTENHLSSSADNVS